MHSHTRQWESSLRSLRSYKALRCAKDRVSRINDAGHAERVVQAQ